MPKAPAYTVIKDTREQDGYTFERFESRYHACAGMVVQKLDTGDYSLVGLEDKLCIERKGRISELAINLGKDKHRFMREIERMKDFPFKFLILEFSLKDVMDFPEGSDIPQENWNSIKITNKYMLKMLIEFQMYDDIHVIFCGNRKNAKLVVSSILKRVNEFYSIGRKK
jgi:glucosamine 6-phosphate synthetase-like amidotransferase/phosphosugar isomerase protein|tara:strand:+ start:6243 stop:6749 length:507 start_codon:yes stop_codon:yes gene_type:complete